MLRLLAWPRAGTSPAPDPERGAALVITALCFVVIVVIAAVVLDLAAVRRDRAANQSAADSAATAAAAELGDLQGGQVACATAVDYVEQITDLGTISGIDCTDFPALCDATTSTVTETGSAGFHTLRLVHPVNDSHPLMQSSAVGAPGESVVAADGHRCGRFAVELVEVHNTFFATVIDQVTLTSSIHAVALYMGDGGQARAINLLLLEREECNALSHSGAASGVGAIIVGAAPDPVTGELVPGRITIDSNGSSSCSGNGTVDANGTNSLIRADGPPGCADELSAGTGHGCGTIETVAPGAPGCHLPACSGTGTIAPAPVQVDAPLTRAPIDWQFNCKATYPAALDIDGCPHPTTTHPYIDQLIAAVGSSGVPAGFASYQDAGHPCNVGGGGGTEVIPHGNWVVDCNLQVNRDIEFEGGNLIFDGDIKIQQSASLTINSLNGGSSTWTEGNPLHPTESSPDQSWVYVRGGTVQKNGQASIFVEHAAVYLAPGTKLSLAGGSGVVDWAAPTDGPFTNLALWSDSEEVHGFSGQSLLTMEGVFFTPVATVAYSGNGSQHSVEAQLIANKLEVDGGGTLTLMPSRSRAIAIPSQPSALIR